MLFEEQKQAYKVIKLLFSSNKVLTEYLKSTYLVVELITLIGPWQIWREDLRYILRIHGRYIS